MCLIYGYPRDAMMLRAPETKALDGALPRRASGFESIWEPLSAGLNSHR